MDLVQPLNLDLVPFFICEFGSFNTFYLQDFSIFFVLFSTKDGAMY